MDSFPDPKSEDKHIEPEKSKSPEQAKQEQTDPNLTELRGLVDPSEPLEPKGTDNDV